LLISIKNKDALISSVDLKTATFSYLNSKSVGFFIIEISNQQ